MHKHSNGSYNWQESLDQNYIYIELCSYIFNHEIPQLERIEKFIQ